VQSFTKVPLDLRKIPADMVSLSSHKIHGPKGVGALFVREGVKLCKQIDGGHQEGDLRAGTENLPGIVGFAKAAELATEKHVAHMTGLRDILINSVFENIAEVRLNGPRTQRLCNNANFSFKYVEGESMLLHLDMRGIAASTGSACSSQSLKPSHVLTAIGLKPEVAHGSLRFTLGRENTQKEIGYTANCLEGIVRNLRKISPLYKG
jgi:cysteine desulfurase